MPNPAGEPSLGRVPWHPVVPACADGVRCADDVSGTWVCASSNTMESPQSAGQVKSSQLESTGVARVSVCPAGQMCPSEEAEDGIISSGAAVSSRADACVPAGRPKMASSPQGPLSGPRPMAPVLSYHQSMLAFNSCIRD